MKIAVVGTGTMGSGIAQVLAQAGHEVLLKGRSEASLAKAHKAMEKNLSRMVEKGKMEAAVKEQALSRVKDTLNYEDCAGVELVIEAIAEDMATKVEVFKLLDGICPAETILATNTYGSGSSHQPSRQSHWDALLQSRACHEIGGTHQRAAYLRRGAR